MEIYKTDYKLELKAEMTQLEIAGVLNVIDRYLPRAKNEYAYISSGDYAMICFPNVTPTYKDYNGDRVKIDHLAVTIDGVLIVIDTQGTTYITGGY